MSALLIEKISNKSTHQKNNITWHKKTYLLCSIVYCSDSCSKYAGDKKKKKTVLQIYGKGSARKINNLSDENQHDSARLTPSLFAKTKYVAVFNRWETAMHSPFKFCQKWIQTGTIP